MFGHDNAGNVMSAAVAMRNILGCAALFMVEE
jgi:hypothetical protein